VPRGAKNATSAAGTASQQLPVEWEIINVQPNTNLNCLMAGKIEKRRHNVGIGKWD